jgi:hypothetical protein
MTDNSSDLGKVLHVVESLSRSQMTEIAKLGDKINCVDKRMSVMESKLDDFKEKHTECRSDRLSVEEELRRKLNGYTVSKADCVETQFRSTVNATLKIVIPIACVLLGFFLSGVLA